MEGFRPLPRENSRPIHYRQISGHLLFDYRADLDDCRGV